MLLNHVNKPLIFLLVYSHAWITPFDQMPYLKTLSFYLPKELALKTYGRVKAQGKIEESTCMTFVSERCVILFGRFIKLSR